MVCYTIHQSCELNSFIYRMNNNMTHCNILHSKKSPAVCKNVLPSTFRGLLTTDYLEAKYQTFESCPSSVQCGFLVLSSLFRLHAENWGEMKTKYIHKAINKFLKSHVYVSIQFYKKSKSFILLNFTNTIRNSVTFLIDLFFLNRFSLSMGFENLLCL